MGTLEKVRNMFKVNSKTPEWCQMRRSVVFIVTLNIFHNSGILIVDFEQVNVKWVVFLVTFLPPYYTKEYSFIQLTLLKVIAIQIILIENYSTNSFDDLMDYFSVKKVDLFKTWTIILKFLSVLNLSPQHVEISTIKWRFIIRFIILYIYTLYIYKFTSECHRLPHPQGGDSQGQETFLASSADKQTRNYDIECSNHHPSLSTLRPKGLSHSKMKWWAIYTNFLYIITNFSKEITFSCSTRETKNTLLIMKYFYFQSLDSSDLK